MLWGSYPAKIDEKSRIRLPAICRQKLPETVDNTYYITSDNGKRAQLYPLPVWERIVQKFQKASGYDDTVQKLQMFTSYYGALSEMDPQGRIVIPQKLRETAQLSGDVTVVGKIDHLEIWNAQALEDYVKGIHFTGEDRKHLTEQGF